METHGEYRATAGFLRGALVYAPIIVLALAISVAGWWLENRVFEWWNRDHEPPETVYVDASGMRTQKPESPARAEPLPWWLLLWEQLKKSELKRQKQERINAQRKKMGGHWEVRSVPMTGRWYAVEGGPWRNQDDEALESWLNAGWELWRVDPMTPIMGSMHGSPSFVRAVYRFRRWHEWKEPEAGDGQRQP